MSEITIDKELLLSLYEILKSDEQAILTARQEELSQVQFYNDALKEIRSIKAKVETILGTEPPALDE